MNIKDCKKIHFIGIGGIGTSALAQILRNRGVIISGSDQRHSDITKKLEASNVKIFYQHSAENIPENTDLIIYSPAINDKNPEIIASQNRGIPMLTYPQALGEFARDYKVIAISGTHGKSTTTAMLALILADGGLDPTVIVGTKVREFNNSNYRVGKSQILVVEACEYKESFLNLHPDILGITNVEPDHLDYFKNEQTYYSAFNKIIKQLKDKGYLFTSEEVTEKLDISTIKNTHIIDYRAHQFQAGVPGSFNIDNASLAGNIALKLGVSITQIKESLTAFNGTWRRMEQKNTHFSCLKFYDDYAHHPTEIRATLKALKEAHPGKKILAIFQPHQYSRTAELLEGFAKSFNEVAKVIIPNIYQVRDTEEDLKKVSAADLVSKINSYSFNATYGESLQKTADIINKNHNKYDIVITMGAGDITEIYDLL